MNVINSYFKVVDNSGIKKIKIIRNLSTAHKGFNIGDLVVGVVKEVKNSTNLNFSHIVYAVIIRTKTNFFDKKWILAFGDNALVLVNKDLNPISSRIFGVMPYKLKQKGYLKLNSLAVSFI